MIKTGKKEGFPYSLSRWTDIPAFRWNWFKSCLDLGYIIGFDPMCGVPSRWSIKPEDTLGLVFWTKDPTNLIIDNPKRFGYHIAVHITVTGWSEVEHGAPSLKTGSNLLCLAADTFGPENVFWRFSPVPIVPDAIDRFKSILERVSSHNIQKVYMSFLQDNDSKLRDRSDCEKRILLNQMAELAERQKVKIILCNYDELELGVDMCPNITKGVCMPPEYFFSSKKEKCGCIPMVDPFTINSKCGFSCEYCYSKSIGLS
jgi:hypothetical protein